MPIAAQNISAYAAQVGLQGHQGQHNQRLLNIGKVCCNNFTALFERFDHFFKRNVKVWLKFALQRKLTRILLLKISRYREFRVIGGRVRGGLPVFPPHLVEVPYQICPK